MSFGTNGVQTTLSAAISDSALTFTVASTASGFPGVGVYGSRQLMLIDAEWMLIDFVPVSGTVKVLQRGYNGTRATAHDTLAEVSTSSNPADFGTNLSTGFVNDPMPWQDQILTIGEDLTFTAAGTAPVSGTSIPIPTRNTTYHINKGSAAAITLISSTVATKGVKLTFISQSAQAHAITYTPGFLGDTTSSDVATSASKVGATFVIQCGPTGLWAPLNASENASTANWTLG